MAFPGGPAGARSVLGTIASAMISVTGLVFSITMVVMQLASRQFSPRILQDFLSTRITQWTLGVFVASFVYALTVLREVRGAADDAEAFVPQLSVSLASLLVLTAFVLFLAFIRTIMSLIQVSQVVSRVGDATCAAVAEHFPEEDTVPEQADWEPRGTPLPGPDGRPPRPRGRGGRAASHRPGAREGPAPRPPAHPGGVPGARDAAGPRVGRGHR
ncbi:MAG: DUF2254 family protein [Micrococcus sp.]|nr:DUF2254 family protein [Micrococcus sp.]MDO4239287.1 DUF2254 family protein [Micrococcus sp.]